TYALALRRGDTAATTVADIEAQFFTQDGNPYTPRNYDFGYHGLVRYREALANSYNIAAVKVLEKVGVESLLRFLQETGLTTLDKPPEHYGLALTLGDAEVKLLELAQAYGMLARGGVTMPIANRLDEPALKGKKVLDEKIAWLITDILSDNAARVAEFGENSALTFDFPVAAKTGTTRNSRDNWTIGFTSRRVVGVWVGNADNSPMKNTSGITGAGPIFHDVMIAAMGNLPRLPFARPDGFVKKEICSLSGMLPTPYCPAKTLEWFIRGTEPKNPDTIWTPIKTDRRNSLIAGGLCPAEWIEEKVFAVFPPELRKWSRENGWPVPPQTYSPLCPEKSEAPPREHWLIIRKPQPYENYQLDPLIPDENEKIIFEAEADESAQTVEWLVDGEKAGIGKAPNFRYEWQPQAGHFEIMAKTPGAEEKVKIEVVLTKID
ncbi:penicillin-binding protein, partial [Candidatus Peregrinibacteria bacterium]|nr:penicillin-binding protein [Candidatus Peregrinibacteria bacterium]